MGLISRVSSRTYRTKYFFFQKQKMSDTEQAPESTLVIKDVFYCPISSLPFEYIEYAPKKVQEKSIDFMIKNIDKLKDRGVNIQNINIPEVLEAAGIELNESQAAKAAANKNKDNSKAQKRGGKSATIASKKLEKAVAAQDEDGTPTNVSIKVGFQQRGKKKNITLVRGLASGGVDQKKACKAFKQKFACSSSVVSPEEIMIQGEFVDDVIQLIQDKFKISEDDIEDIGLLKGQ